MSKVSIVSDVFFHLLFFLVLGGGQKHSLTALTFTRTSANLKMFVIVPIIIDITIQLLVSEALLNDLTTRYVCKSNPWVKHLLKGNHVISSYNINLFLFFRRHINILVGF